MPGLGLEIQSQEGMKDVVSEKGHEQKTLHGLGVMFEDAIGIPLVDQLVKARIFDAPWGVAGDGGGLGGNLGGGRRGQPNPWAVGGTVVWVDKPAHPLGHKGTRRADDGPSRSPGNEGGA